jgi:hypothetical protein
MRCKACNCILSPNEIIWIEDKQIHEELCTSCKDLLEDETEEIYMSDEEILAQLRLTGEKKNE